MEYPRVTEILRPYIDYTNVPPQVLQNAAERGKKVHSLCAEIAKDQWIPDNVIDDSLVGYIQSFRQWSDSFVSKYQVIEKRYIHTELAYSGQVDFVLLDKAGDRYLVDLKTSAHPQKTYSLQLAAYRNLLDFYYLPVKGCILVYLDKGGKEPKVTVMTESDRELGIFISALNCWHYFHKCKGINGVNQITCCCRPSRCAN